MHIIFYFLFFHIIDFHPNISGFNVLEQVSIAALDCNRIDVAASCIHTLIKEFPKSLRVRTLIVMKLEAQER